MIAWWNTMNDQAVATVAVRVMLQHHFAPMLLLCTSWKRLGSSERTA